jgi:N-methylhydantoinase A
MQFRGQTHLIRVAFPRAEVSRAEIQALFEAAYDARFQVRLPEIKAVLVNLVTSVIGRRPAFPIASLLEPAGRSARVQDAVIGERQLFADGRWRTAQVFDRVKLPLARASPGRPSCSRWTPPP